MEISILHNLQFIPKSTELLFLYSKTKRILVYTSGYKITYV